MGWSFQNSTQSPGSALSQNLQSGSVRNQNDNRDKNDSDHISAIGGMARRGLEMGTGITLNMTHTAISLKDTKCYPKDPKP